MNGQHEYLIYQLKDTPETQDFRFKSYSWLELTGKTCELKNYNLVYNGAMEVHDTLDALYDRFNIQRPADFTGHSMSISDVVVIQQSTSEAAAYYVDNIGFKKLTDFMKENEK